MLWLLIAFSILNVAFANYGQRVPPGVNPQQYQQPGYQQHPQHVQQQGQQQFQQQQQGYQQQQPQQQAYQQQVPVQQQQVPVQQQQVPVQQQQVPVQQQHVPVQQQQVPVQPQHHGHPQGQNVQILNPTNMEHEKEHIAEHMEVPIDTSKMSEQELQFHYFKMHDADNNNKLDGCELIKSLIHWHEQGHKHGDQAAQPTAQEKIFADEELTTLIDPILNMDDHNKDGYIDYPEFVRAQQKNHQNQPKN